MQKLWRPLQRRASPSLHGASMAYEMLQNTWVLPRKSCGGQYRDGPPRASMLWGLHGIYGNQHNLDPIPLGNQTARAHAQTKRNDFPVEQPPTYTNDPTGFGLHIVSPDPSLAPPAFTKLGKRLASCYPISGRGKWSFGFVRNLVFCSLGNVFAQHVSSLSIHPPSRKGGRLGNCHGLKL